MRILMVLLWVLTWAVLWGFSSASTYQLVSNRSSQIDQVLVDAGMVKGDK